MRITSRQKRIVLGDTLSSLPYNDSDISMTKCDKILSIHVDNNLTWNIHFNFLSKEVSSYLWLLSKIITYLSTEHRLLFIMQVYRNDFKKHRFLFVFFRFEGKRVKLKIIKFFCLFIRTAFAAN